MTRPDGTDGRPRQAGDTGLPVPIPPGCPRSPTGRVISPVSVVPCSPRFPASSSSPGWSPGAGDLGLQVLEWWAYLADILTFYNERIANDSYLRTAAGPQGPPVRNVAGLVRLLGYLAGRAPPRTGVLAAIRSPGAAEEALIVPAGLQITSTPAAGVPAQVFETGGSVRFRGPSDVPIGLPPDDDLFQPADTTPEDARPAEVSAAGRARHRPAW